MAKPTVMQIIDRIKNILITPNTEWPAIERETPNISTIFVNYVLPLLGIGAAAIFIGTGLISSAVTGFGLWGFKTGITSAIVYVILTTARIFIVALVIDLLAPSFESEKNFNRSFQLSAYSFTASYIGALFFILPVLSFLAVLCTLYCIYTMYVGVPVIKKTPQDKQVAYTAIIILVSIVAMAVLSLIQAGFFRMVYGLGYGFRLM